MSMKDLTKFLGNLIKIESFAKKEADKIIVKNKKDIVDMNKEQMLEGFDSDGFPLGDYAPMSVELRKAKGLQTKHIDLKDTGAFHKSIKLEKKKENEFQFNATDWKWEQELKPRWPDALGLDEIHEKDVEILLAENLTKSIANYLRP